MERHVLVVLTNTTEGTDDEYNRWYDEVHLPDVLAVPGFVAAQRFVAGASVGPPSPHRYLALYEIEAEDLQDAIATLQAAAAKMHIASTIDRAGASVFGFTALGPRVTREELVG